jgi:hypothetical protein
MQSDAATSFQKPMTGTTTGIAAPPRQRQGDPFYLDAGPTQDEQRQREDSKFGMIQLFDSDEEVEAAKKKRREKKQKRSMSKNGSTNLMSFGDASSGMPPPVTMYDSGDDEDDAVTPAGKKGGPGREFAGLAKVDLTTPLREDEIMPERRHRIVPERPSSLTEQKASDKKKKRSKKRKKDGKAAPPLISEANVEGDLLDLGGIDQTHAFTSPLGLAATSSSATATANAISDAFGDLLGLSAPAPAPRTGGNDTNLLSSQFEAISSPPPSAPSKKSSSKRRPWMRASLKASDASVAADLSLLYRVYRANDGNAASIVFRLDNNGFLPLTATAIELQQQSIALGDVAAGSSTESAKLGPFTYSQPDSSESIKGALTVAGSSVPLKLSLPASSFLSPETVSLEQIAQELANASGWSSSSVKIESSSSSDTVKSVLASFLRAHQVEDGSSPATATFAAYTSSGARCRAMVKIKDGSVKVDLKCSSPSLGKALASDLKRLVL